MFLASPKILDITGPQVTYFPTEREERERLEQEQREEEEREYQERLRKLEEQERKQRARQQEIEDRERRREEERRGQTEDKPKVKKIFFGWNLCVLFVYNIQKLHINKHFCKNANLAKMANFQS